MTYRERRERRAERRQEWAAGREQKSEAAFGRAEQVSSLIPFGQPILVGHHSEGHARRDQERIRSGMAKGFEHLEKAQEHRQAAETIAAQLAHSIYDDDPDAVEALQARIEALEAERARVKQVNAAVRKGGVAALATMNPPLSEREKRDLLNAARFAPGGTNGGYPGYHLTNLSGNINRQKKRLERLQAGGGR